MAEAWPKKPWKSRGEEKGELRLKKMLDTRAAAAETKARDKRGITPC